MTHRVYAMRGYVEQLKTGIKLVSQHIIIAYDMDRNFRVIFTVKIAQDIGSNDYLLVTTIKFFF